MNTAVWAIIALVVLVSGFILGYDLWAQATNHVTISGQLHTWILDQLWGPLLVGGIVGSGAGLLYHVLINK